MREETRRASPTLAQRALVVLVVALTATALATAVGALSHTDGQVEVGFVLVTVLLGLAFASAGALLLGVRTAGPLGPLFLVSGAALVLEMAFRELAYDGLAFGSASTLDRVLGWSSSWLDVLGMPLGLVLALLLFPDGVLPSRWWRPALGAALAVGILHVLLRMLGTGPWDLESHGVAVPWDGVLGWDRAGVERADEALGAATILLLLVGAAAVATRYRSGAAEVRRRLVPLLLAIAIMLLGLVLQLAAVLDPAGVLVFVIGGMLVPVALAVGALRYRLWDLDPALVSTIQYGALAVLVTVLDVVLVQVLSLAFGQRLSSEVVLPTVAATLVVAVVFAPLKERVQRAARRIVYGERATPYETLTSLPQRLVDAPTGDDVLPATAETLARGLGASAAGASVLLEGGAQVTSWYPAAPTAAAVVEEVPVRHVGLRVGSLYVVAEPDRPLTRGDEKLLSDLAAQAGAALHAVRQAEELAESRRRLSVAHSQERLRLQRDLHDGVQQRLVTVAMRVGAARARLPDDADDVRDELAAAETEVSTSLDEIREVARGLHPSTLAARGLPAALRTRAAVAQQPVTVVADALDGRRFPDEVEAAVYYSCLEALQNAAKHAPSASVTIVLELVDGHLEWTVRDDGAGFDPAAASPSGGLAGLRDRVAALRGRLEVSSGAQGTTVRGAIPLPAGAQNPIGRPA